jgi:hypothetical protein
MTHIAISEHRDGTVVPWMEKVSDEQDSGAPVSPREAERTPMQTAVTREQPAQPSVDPRPAADRRGACHAAVLPWVLLHYQLGR